MRYLRATSVSPPVDPGLQRAQLLAADPLDHVDAMALGVRRGADNFECQAAPRPDHARPTDAIPVERIHPLALGPKRGVRVIALAMDAQHHLLVLSAVDTEDGVLPHLDEAHVGRLEVPVGQGRQGDLPESVFVL